MRITKWALVAALLVSASSAFASNGEKGDWELGGYGGHGWVDDYGGFDPGDDMLYGGRLGFFFSRYFSMEASAQRLPTESGPLQVNLNSYRGNAIVNFAPGSRFRPFLTVGAGVDNTNIEGLAASSNLGLNGGGGFRIFVTPRFSLRADGRVSRVSVDALDDTQYNMELTAGLSLLFGGGGEEEPLPVETPPVVNQPPLISCTTDRPEVLPGESVTITATASDPENDPITYAWTTSAGRVNGNGGSATLSFDGTTEPSMATVTVSATDNHGNTSTSTCAVTVSAPARAAESVSCLAGGFPRNLSRLTNVDKACLDDVATRLKSDPRARVFVIGHADRRETASIGDQRGSAVKEYLVQTGVDGSRITVRSMGSTRLLDTGTTTASQQRNRRVEVWFVPEGAKEPE
jgi:outer membrane protein OmpA-like peptidoglycan-associated protein